MSLRTPDDSVEIPSLTNMEPVLKWHNLSCELVTPMYGGGVKSVVVDEQMPIRTSSIRGQLRFWWRLLAKHKDGFLGNEVSNSSPEKIREVEFALWGGMGSGDDEGTASQVFLRVSIQNRKPKIESWASYEPNRRGRDVLQPKDWAEVPYALFPAQGRSERNPNEEPHALLREGFKWNIKVAFSSQLEESSILQVWETIRWWSNFGGVGARTRRGLGSFKIYENDFFNSVVSIDEIKALGFNVAVKPSNNAYAAWTTAIKSLQNFRQIGQGRNDYSSRSHWPEPDAIRHYTGQSLPNHSVRKTQDNYFPRAAFGLPIIFKFKDGGSNDNQDPDVTTLKVNYRVSYNETLEFERLMSPLILRPYLNERGSWQAIALLLPEPLKNDSKIQLMLDNIEVDFWNEESAKEVKPINNYNSNDPMQAFLTYFAK
ncbi:type III-B CRISPR module RAMP protein Cmr1 [Psychrobacter piscatorii]|uniref:type III-B CRISPR module RAMP protein Cmr1 n=1 Tax=Psychrobacter piscatorii TaxID=554343 RepID=UPI0037363CAB